MMRRRLLLLACLLLAGCDQGPAGDGALKVGIWSAANSLDPQRATNDAERMAASLLYPGLVQWDSAGQIVPALAESWNISADGLVYIFRLRDARWSDGTPVSAEDVVYSMRRLFDARRGRRDAATQFDALANASAVAKRLKPVSALGIRVLAPMVIEIRLDYPEPALLSLLATPAAAVLPQHALRKNAGFQLPLVTGGGFSMEKLADGFGFVRSSKDTGGFARIQLIQQRDPAAALAAFASGKVDILDVAPVPFGMMETQGSRVREALRSEPGWINTGLVFNLESAPVKDVRLRRALALATDRGALLKAAFADLGYRATESLLPPGLPSYGEPTAPSWAAWTREQRITEAQRLLAEMGYAAGNKLALRILHEDGDAHDRIVQALSDQWSTLPIAVNAIPAASGRPFNARRLGGGYDLAVLRYGVLLDSPERGLALFGCASASLVRNRLCNSEADKLFTGALPNADPATRLAALHRAEQLLLEDVPAISLFAATRRTLVRKSVRGWTDNVQGSHPLHLLEPAP